MQLVMAHSIWCILSCMSLKRISIFDMESYSPIKMATKPAKRIFFSSGSEHFTWPVNLSQALLMLRKPGKQRTIAMCIVEHKKWIFITVITTYSLSAPNKSCFFQTPSVLMAGAAQSEWTWMYISLHHSPLPIQSERLWLRQRCYGDVLPFSSPMPDLSGMVLR